MSIQPNYYQQYVSWVEEDAQFIENQPSDVESKLPEIVSHLNFLDRCVKLCSPEEDKKTLHAAIIALNHLKRALQRVSCQNLNEQIVSLITLSLTLLKDEQGLDLSNECKKNDLSLTSRMGYMPSVVCHSYGVFGYSIPVPFRAHSYVFKTFINEPQRNADIVSIMKGIDVKFKPATLEMIQAPEQFVLDIKRPGSEDTFKLNDVDYQKDPVALVRELNRRFGVIGADRIMLVCSQGTASYLLGKILTEFNDDNGFQGVLAAHEDREDLISPNKLSLNYDIKISGNDVKIVIKMLYGIKAAKTELYDFYFVTKSTLEFPLIELIKEDFLIDENPLPHLKSEELISVLMKDLAESKTLLSKI